MICKKKRKGEGGGDSFFWVRGRIGARRIGGLEERHKKRKKNNCNQGCPSMLLITLGVFIHIQSLNLVVSENSMYCWWLVWTKRATICFVEIGYSLASPVLDSDSLMCHWCHLKFLTPCLNVIVSYFSFKSYSAFFPLFLAHGLISEVEAIHVYWSIPSAISFSKFYFNFFIYFYLYSFPRMVFEPWLLYLGIRWGMM